MVGTPFALRFFSISDISLTVNDRNFDGTYPSLLMRSSCCVISPPILLRNPSKSSSDAREASECTHVGVDRGTSCDNMSWTRGSTFLGALTQPLDRARDPTASTRMMSVISLRRLLHGRPPRRHCEPQGTSHWTLLPPLSSPLYVVVVVVAGLRARCRRIPPTNFPRRQPERSAVPLRVRLHPSAPPRRPQATPPVRAHTYVR